MHSKDGRRLQQTTCMTSWSRFHLLKIPINQPLKFYTFLELTGS